MVSSDEPSKLLRMPSASLAKRANSGQTSSTWSRKQWPVPTRRVVLAWRRSFTRYEAIVALRNAVYACKLDGVARLS